ncbi:MAG: hypothetical protein ACK4ON_06550, partial [Bacteroidia bacterium]
MKHFIFTLLFVSFSLFSYSQAPTVQASNVQITYKTESGATISWTRGNGEACIVVVRQASSPNVTPSYSTTTAYTASAMFGNGSNLGSGNYVVYNGTGTNVFIYGLSPNTIYYAYVYEYNKITILSTNYYYYNTSTNSSSNELFGTLDTSPSAASSITSVVPNYTSATINVSSGSGGDGRLIYLRNSSASNAYPLDGYAYTASTTFGSGSALGGGYIVYSNTGNSVVVSNLTPATTYYVYSHVYSDGTYPTTSVYAYNSRNYLNGTGYSFSTNNNPPTISINGAASGTICQDAGWQSFSLKDISDGSILESQTVTISTNSNNSVLIPDGNIYVSHSSGSSTGTVYYYPKEGQYGTAVITVTANDGYATTPTTSVQYTVTVNPKPLAAGNISVNGIPGPSTAVICGGTTVSLSVPAITYATGYNWNLPTGCTILSGANTNAITVSTPTVSAISNYTISVVGTNNC